MRIETKTIIVETDDDGATITAKHSDYSTIRLNEQEAADLWATVMMQYDIHRYFH